MSILSSAINMAVLMCVLPGGWQCSAANARLTRGERLSTDSRSFLTMTSVKRHAQAGHDGYFAVAMPR